VWEGGVDKKERGKTFFEGHRPEINRILLIFLILVLWQCYRRGGEGGEDECVRYDEIRAGGGG